MQLFLRGRNLEMSMEKKQTDSNRILVFDHKSDVERIAGDPSESPGKMLSSGIAKPITICSA
jgi:hypothetical protein